MSNIKSIEEMNALAESTGLCGGTIGWDGRVVDVEILYLSPTGARVSIVNESDMAAIEEAVHIVFSVDRFEDLRASVIWRRNSVLGLQFDGAVALDASIAPSDADIAAQATGDDRRKYPRKRVMLTAHLDVQDILYPCRILDISLVGARLQIGEELPEESLMQLATKRFGLLPIEVMWRVSDHVGAQFLEPPDTINMILKDFLTE